VSKSLNPVPDLKILFEGSLGWPERRKVGGVVNHSPGPSYTVTWNTTGLTNGSYQLKATFTDTAGNTSTSAKVTVAVTVNNPNKLVITSAAVTGVADLGGGANLGPITVQQQTATGTPVNAAVGGLTVTLSGPSGSSFASSQFASSVTTVTIPNGDPSTTFWYGNSNTGTPTITVSASGLTSGSQQETITTAPAGLGIVITGGTGTPIASCGAVSTSYTCTITGDGFPFGDVTVYATFVNSTGTQIVYSHTQTSTIFETGWNTGNVTIAANASSSNPNTLTASHAGNSTKTSTLTFGPYTLTINVKS